MDHLRVQHNSQVGDGLGVGDDKNPGARARAGHCLDFGFSSAIMCYAICVSASRAGAKIRYSSDTASVTPSLQVRCSSATSQLQVRYRFVTGPLQVRYSSGTGPLWSVTGPLQHLLQVRCSSVTASFTDPLQVSTPSLPPIE